MKKIIIGLIICSFLAMVTLAMASANPFYLVDSSRAGDSFYVNKGFWPNLPDGCYFELVHYFERQGDEVVVCRSKLKEMFKEGDCVTPTGRVWEASGAGSVQYALESSGADTVVLDFKSLGDGGKTTATIAVLKKVLKS